MLAHHSINECDVRAAPETLLKVAEAAAEAPGIDATQFIRAIGEAGIGGPGTVYDAIQAGYVDVRSPNNVYPGPEAVPYSPVQ